MPATLRPTPADRRPPTLQQGAVLEYVRGYHAEHGYAPTFREIAEAMGVSHITIFGHVRLLRDKGFVRVRPNVARGIELVGGRCPTCGHVTE